MICTLEYNEIYKSIVIEFKLNTFILEEMKIAIKSLVKSRLDLYKLLKLENAKTETLDLIKLELIRYININECNIMKIQKDQIELSYEINKIKQDIKVTKLQINKLENEFWRERKKSRNLREDFRVFAVREKFKTIKIHIVKKYKIVFKKYSNELSIKTEIERCNERKDKLRKEKQNLIYSMDKYNKKINTLRIKLAGFRKSITNMSKDNEFFKMKILSINDYKEMEDKFKIKCKMMN